MGIKLRFDSEQNIEAPIYILGTRNGSFEGSLPAYDINLKDSLNSASEISFRINKLSCTNIDGEFDRYFWDKIRSLKTMYCKEYDRWYELAVEINENDACVKNVIATSLGRAELSQQYLYGYEINTETDIARDDYEPSVLYNPENTEASILHRILKKAPHYRIGHVDQSIANIQRSFRFDGDTIDQAFDKVSEEINCIVEYDCKAIDEFGGIDRVINVYDLECVCKDCGERGEFRDECTKCGSTNFATGYGTDTTVFVSKDNLANEITYEVDTGSVKNCFRLVAGDDLMTATVASCNPNGGSYIWYISDEMREDMSDELKNALESYDALYTYYQDEYIFRPDQQLIDAYNAIVSKYLSKNPDLEMIGSDVTGYANLMHALYNTIDLELFLTNKLMPSVSMEPTDANDESAKLTGSDNCVAVADTSKITLTTATSAVEAWAKSLIRNTFTVKASNAAFTEGVWTGTVTVTNVSNADDTTSVSVSATFTSNAGDRSKQQIESILNKKSTDKTDVVALFSLDNQSFQEEITKYCLVSLSSFRDACQSVLDILIQQGAAYNNTNTYDLYYGLYLPYRAKLDLLDAEIKTRENEILIAKGNEENDGMRSLIVSEKDKIQSELNFEQFIGEELWVEFSSYCREDTYKNENYISDGLTNDELFKTAQEFLETARKEIFSSATSQHIITAKLKNLLSMAEFKPIVNDFAVGNWIRVQIDDCVYRLRLIGFQFNYDNISSLSVEFSDVRKGSSCMSDLQSILKQSASMASSYGAVSRQAKNGSDGANTVDGWVEDGLALTNMKIVDNADNQSIVYDSHGLLGREYIPFFDEYDDKQIKLINSGIYMTDDAWKSVKVAIGKLLLADGTTTYGINAERVIGKLFVGENMKILDSAGNDMFVVMDGKIASSIQGVNQKITQLEQTEQGIQIRIGQLADSIGDAERVRTTTGYTFDENGMRISKSGEEIENLITNDGMYVNRGENNLLTVNNVGVNAINITTRQYLIIGEHARFEQYGDRTACFYI